MHLLDNPIWNALNTSLAHLAKGSGAAKKFIPEISLLGGFEQASADTYSALANLVESGERAGVFVDEDPISPHWNIVSSLGLLQMLHDGRRLNHDPAEPEMARLGPPDVPEMLALTKLTKPGPFASRTHEMGNYFGIREDGALVAMAGERLKLPELTEISAVCTHPEHLGKGHAGRLMAHVLQGIQDRGERAFLHVRPDNARAIALYERLGFEKRSLRKYVLMSKVG